MPVNLALWEAKKNGRITIQGQPGENVHETPISKITRAKWTGGMAQVVGRPLCKCEALKIKNPRPTPKKKKKKKRLQKFQGSKVEISHKLSAEYQVLWIK
jgi:hypothetical protein